MEYDLTKSERIKEMGLARRGPMGDYASGIKGSSLGISGISAGSPMGIVPGAGSPCMGQGHPWSAGTGIGIGIGIGYPWPAQADPWTYGKSDWEEQEAIKQKARQWDLAKIISENQKKKIDFDEMLRKGFGADSEAERKSDQAQQHARGIEAAEGALGARHFFRQALQAGHRLGLIRCWSAACERGFDAELLSKGVSETLITAALGADPIQALGWLCEKGFKPGRAMASQAMLTMLASGQPRPVGLAELIGLFGAGTLEPKALQAIELACKGLSPRALANAEAYEMEQLAGKGREQGKAARL